MKILVGDVREKLKELPDESIQCVVTSPPYYGLRDYGTGSWEGGDPDCDHLEDRFSYAVSEKQRSNSASGSKMAKDICKKCGAKRTDNQIGLEDSPEEYVQELVGVFREIKRVLRDDGTVWLNLGTSYFSQDTASQDMVLRDDLSADEISYVLDELKKHAESGCE